MIIRSLNRTLLPVLFTVYLSGCGGHGNGGVAGPGNEYDFRPILVDFTNNVVIATYRNIDNNASALADAALALREAASEEALSSARDAWTATRAPWEYSEGFLFGPVDFNGFDPALDSWPVNRVDLDAVLAGDSDLTVSYVNTLDGTLKGFHTIEYLLFEDGGSKTVDQFTDRQFDYLIASTRNLAQTASALHESWLPTGGDFGSRVMNAGSGSDIYPSQRSAIQEIVNGMIGICDEVANGKIADPFVEQDTRLVESQFSYNSIEDFQNNIRSVQNAYTGDYAGVAGHGLDEFVASEDAALDARLKSEIETAITQIGQISYPFRDAIFTDAAQIETAQQAVARVQLTLEDDILPLVLGQ